jgi:hypothetical protein
MEARVFGEGGQSGWDEFVRTSKNATFLLLRGFMDYHRDRFCDHSLLFFHGDELVALLPANLRGDTLESHGGLTYGGVLSTQRMRTVPMLEVFETLMQHCHEHGVTTVVYKPIPHIYHALPAEEDMYALFRWGARLVARGVSTTVDLRASVGYTKGRKWSINRARKADVRIGPSDDYSSFMAIEEAVLAKYHQTRPAHSAQEISLLAQRFPKNIQLYGATVGGVLHAGAIVFECDQVAHAQYIAATDVGREVGATDLLLDHLIRERYATKRFFDFGISTEQRGQVLNEGLVEYKESFGGRATNYDVYEVTVQ